MDTNAIVLRARQIIDFVPLRDSDISSAEGRKMSSVIFAQLNEAGGPEFGSSGDCDINLKRERGNHDCTGYADSGTAQQCDPDR